MNKSLFAVAFTMLATINTNALAGEQTHSLPLSKPGQPVSVEIEVVNGNITVIGYEGDTIEISATTTNNKNDKNSHELKKIHKANRNRSPARSSQGLKSISGNMLRLEIEEDNNVVEIKSEISTQYVNLIIKVPHRSKLDISLYYGGDIKVDSVQGGIELESYKGAIYANNISGPIVAETHLKDIVVVFSDFNETSPSSLTSHSGNIDITLTKSIAANITVQSYQGEILSGLEQEFVSVEEVKKTKRGNKQKITIGKTMQAKLNGGGQELSLTTYSGNLYIRKAK